MNTAIASPAMGYLDNAGQLYELAAQGWLVVLWLLVFFLAVAIFGYIRNRDP